MTEYKNHILGTLLLLLLLLTGIQQGAAQTSKKLTGTPIGSTSYDYNKKQPSTTVNTPACAFDGNLNTFYASYDRSYTWVGMDLGEPHVITRVGWCPRKDSQTRVKLALLEGANNADFTDAVPLYIIPEDGTNNTLQYADVRVTRGFRYVRYVGPNDARCNVAEVEFYGYKGEGTDSLFYQLTNLPTVSIHTYSGREITSKTVEQDANITITYDGGTRIQEYPILARGRGNASWGFPKKPYRIKFNDGKSHHMLKDSPLESPAKAKKWTLINNYGDKTLMRNCIAFEMSRRLSMPYTTYCQPVDVILNGEYKGCYQLCDQISVDKDRVNITEMEPTDIAEPELTGGYLIEVDAYADREISWFTSSHSIPVTIKSPADDEITTQQKKYIRDYFNLLESSLWSTKYTDQETGFRTLLDVESFLRHFLVGEFSGNTDTYWSTYMYKDREETRFTVAPVWDFDLAFENDNRTYPINNLSDWIYRTKGSAAAGMSSFVSRVLSDKNATARLKEIWAEMRHSGAFSKTSLQHYVDSMASVLDASQKLNFKRWPILSTKVHQNYQALGSYSAEVATVRNYIAQRIDWIDNKLDLGQGGEEDIQDTIVEISRPEDLLLFANIVNSGGNRTSAFMMNDIDMSAHSSKFTAIGTGKYPFQGNFDGQGFRIRGLSITGNAGTGIFGVIADGATIRNFILDGSCSISGTSYVGIAGVSSGTGNITFSKVGNEAAIHATGKNAGGLLGCNMGSAATLMITDCYNTGSITGDKGESGALCGLAGTKVTMKNCWNSGNLTGYTASKALGTGTYKNTNCYSTVGTQCNSLTQEQILSGELCYNLNEGRTEECVWKQTIGTDPQPSWNRNSEVVLYDLATDIYYNEVNIPDPIHTIRAYNSLSEDAYDLSGRKLHAKPQKGFYIINHRKNVIR